jgi:hypothetical protein
MGMLVRDLICPQNQFEEVTVHCTVGFLLGVSVVLSRHIHNLNFALDIVSFNGTNNNFF